MTSTVETRIEPEVGLPYFWSAVTLMTLHWLSAAVVASLWFDLTGLDSISLRPNFFWPSLTILVGFQVALWIGHAEYLAICRQFGMNRRWMFFWWALLLGGLWQVPWRTVEDLGSPYADVSFLATLDSSYMLPAVLLALLLLCQLPILLWCIPSKSLTTFWLLRLVEKLWQVELVRSFSIRGILGTTSFVALILFAEVKWALVSDMWGLWAFVAYCFFAMLVTLAAMTQPRAWIANSIHIVIWVVTGFLVFIICDVMYPLLQNTLGQQVHEATRFLLCGFFFGRLLILVVRALDGFPPILAREFLEGRISRRAIPRRRSVVVVLLTLAGTQCSWSLFAGRYQPSVLICSEKNPVERARLVARFSQLHRLIRVDQQFASDFRGRFFAITPEDSLNLFVAKEVARDIRWLTLVQEYDAADLGVTWVHPYPQDNLAFFEPPHFSYILDLNMIYPGTNEWSLLLQKPDHNTVELYGGYWTQAMVEAIQTAKFRLLYLDEPEFAPDFSPEVLKGFSIVRIDCRFVEGIVDRPTLYLELIRNGADVTVMAENAELIRKQLLQVPEFDGQIEVVEKRKGVLKLRPKLQHGSGLEDSATLR
ncbi:MAG: hypothetical protein JNL67_22440 [Planctomycetaceae bacterium]|nr:hypothetical protein [Planctomycetaceae bacterium]